LKDEARTAAPAVSLAAVRERCPEKIPTGALYANLIARGLQHGANFRGLVELWRGDKQAMGRVVLPVGLSGDLGDYAAHPALVDACLHVLGAAFLDADGADTVLLPKAIQQVRFFDALRGNCIPTPRLSGR